MSPAAEIREHLAAARAAGIDFDVAWPEAMAEIVPPIEGHWSTAVRARREWRHALKSTRGAWENAYVGAPEVAGEAAALELEGLAA